MKYIAELIGVDTSTVSRALSGSKRVKPQTKEAIIKLAEELDYHPNELARGLVTRRTNTIGIIVPEVSNSFYSSILMSIEKVLTSGNYSMILGLSHYESQKEKDYFDLFLSKNVDGLISFSTIFLGNKHLIEDNFPMVLVDFKDSTQNVDLIASDNIYGIKLGIDHLVSLGHRNIAFITDEVTTSERLRAFKMITTQYGLNCSDYIVLSKIKYEEGGFQGVEKLLRAGVIPTAIFCANDYMALGALQAIELNGLSVPDDVSIVGFDDSTILNYLIRSVTTVRQPKHQLGEQAAKLLIQRIKEKELGKTSLEKKKIILKPELVIRKSTSICRK